MFIFVVVKVGVAFYTQSLVLDTEGTPLETEGTPVEMGMDKSSLYIRPLHRILKRVSPQSLVVSPQSLVVSPQSLVVSPL